MDPSESLYTEIDICKSSLQTLWVALTYATKFAILLIGLYFTWQTRRVTLPSLKDTLQISVMVFTVIVLGVMGLPLLLNDNLSREIRYLSGALSLWIATTVTITLLFIPKVGDAEVVL